jgi:hypothetical protein
MLENILKIVMLMIFYPTLDLDLLFKYFIKLQILSATFNFVACSSTTTLSPSLVKLIRLRKPMGNLSSSIHSVQADLSL